MDVSDLIAAICKETKTYHGQINSRKFSKSQLNNIYMYIKALQNQNKALNESLKRGKNRWAKN